MLARALKYFHNIIFFYCVVAECSRFGTKFLRGIKVGKDELNFLQNNPHEATVSFPDGVISVSIDTRHKNISLQKCEANLTSNFLLTNFFLPGFSLPLYICYKLPSSKRFKEINGI